MKKILLFLIVFLVTACGNISSGEVNSYLNKYHDLDKELLSKIDIIIKDNNFNDEVNDLYLKVYKRQFKDMKYQILDYKCEKNTCDIPVDIEVYDYLSIQKEALEYLALNEELFTDNDGFYDINLYEKYKLEQMLNTNTRVKYTITFHLEKHFFNWYITTLNNQDVLKIHGLYE